MKILSKTTIQTNDNIFEEHILPLTEDYVEIEYDFGSENELEERHPNLYPVEVDDNEYEVTYVTDDKGKEYDLNAFMRLNPPSVYVINGESIEIHGYKTTSNFGGIGLEIADSGDACRLYEIWS